MEAAANKKDYKCQQCGCNYKMNNLKRNMVRHLSHEANKKCLDHYSESRDKREMEWVRLAASEAQSTPQSVAQRDFSPE